MLPSSHSGASCSAGPPKSESATGNFAAIVFKLSKLFSGVTRFDVPGDGGRILSSAPIFIVFSFRVCGAAKKAGCVTARLSISAAASGASCSARSSRPSCGEERIKAAALSCFESSHGVKPLQCCSLRDVCVYLPCAVQILSALRGIHGGRYLRQSFKSHSS